MNSGEFPDLPDVVKIDSDDMSETGSQSRPNLDFDLFPNSVLIFTVAESPVISMTLAHIELTTFRLSIFISSEPPLFTAADG